MKRGIRIGLYAFGGLVLLLLISLFVLPLVFKPQILRFAKSQIAQHVNADVDFSDLTVSIWRGFPDLYVALEGVSVVNRAPFSGDTLAAFDRFALRVNMGSLFDLSNVQVRSIQLERPRLLAQRDTMGRASWDIAVGSVPDSASTDSVVSQEVGASEVSQAEGDAAKPLRVRLEGLRIVDGLLVYRDDSARMVGRVEGLDFALRGDLGADRSMLNLELLLEKVFFTQAGVELAPGVRVAFAAGVDADLVANRYRLQKNRLSLNEFALLFDGEVSLPGDSVVLDLRFGTESADFKTLLSLVPGIYRKDFSSLQVGGEVALEGVARGVLHGEELPSAQLDLRVRDGMFQYPSLPKRVESIQLGLGVAFNGRYQDSTRVDLRELSLQVAGNPVRLQGWLATPLSDPSVGAKVSGRVHLGSLGEVVPLDDMALSGVLDLDVDLSARKSHVDSKQYELCRLVGGVKLHEATFSGVLNVPARVDELDVSFSPHRVSVNALRARAGRSDVSMRGGVQDFLPYLFSDGTLRGQLDLSSDTVDLVELFPPSDDATGADSVEATEAPRGGNTLSVDFSPLDRIAFRFSSRIGHVRMNPVPLDAVVGDLSLSGNRLSFEEVSCRTLGGAASLLGHFDYSSSTHRDAQVNAAFRGIDLGSCVRAFSLDKLLSTLQHATGQVNLRLDAGLQLDSKLSPIMNTVQADGELSSTALRISGSPFFDRLGSMLENADLREPTLAAAQVSFAVRDGVISFRPFETKLAGMPTRVEGSAGLDQTVDFRFGMEVPRSKLGRLNSTVDQLASQFGMLDALGAEVPIRVGVKGPAADPSISIELDPSYTGRVADAAKRKAQEALADAKRRVSEEYDKLLREAEVQGAKLISEAESAGEKLREEARRRADQMLSEAKKKGMLAEIAAKKGVQLVLDEADRGAAKLVEEAKRQSEALIAQAKAEGERLKEQ